MILKKNDDSLFNDLFGIAKSRKGAKTVANILEASLGLLEEEGWPNITQEKVAEKAGIKAATLRYYYPIKEDLTAAICKSLGHHVKELLLKRIDETLKDPVKRFVNLIDAMLMANEEVNEVLVWELWAFSAHNKTANETAVAFYDWMMELISDRISGMKPEFSTQTCLCRAAAIISLMDGAHVFVGKTLFKKMDLSCLRSVYRESMFKIAGIDANEISIE